MENQESGKRSRVFIILLLLLLIVAAWLLYTEKNTSENLKQDKVVLEQDLADIATKYEAILSDKDSLDTELIAERNRILALRDSVSMLTDNVRLLERYRNEVRKIRREREDLLARADSLLAANKLLQETAQKLGDTLTAERVVNKQLSDVNNQLQTRIKAGAVLEAQALTATAIKIRNNGSEKPVDKASKADKFKSCFTLGKNLLSEKGNKIVYLRIVNPDGEVEIGGHTGNNELTLADGSKLEFSEKKEVYYENAAIDMCIYLDAPETTTFGTYTVEVYCEGLKIGSNTFKLEDSLF